MQGSKAPFSTSQQGIKPSPCLMTQFQDFIEGEFSGLNGNKRRLGGLGVFSSGRGSG